VEHCTSSGARPPAIEALDAGDRRHFGSAFGRTVGGVAIHSPRSLAEAVLAAGR